MKSKKRFVLILLALVCVAAGVVFKLKLDQASIRVLCPKSAAESLRKVADSYQGEDLPRIKVQAVDDAKFAEAVKDNLSGKNPVDLVVFTKDALYPSDEVLSQMRDLSSLPGVESCFLSLQEGERVSLLPVCGDIPVIYYNADFFTEQHQPVPESTYDFLVMCDDFQSLGVCPLGLPKDLNSNGPDLASLVDCSLTNNINSPFLDMPVALFNSLEENDIFKQSPASDREKLIVGFRDGAYPMFMGFWTDASLVKSIGMPFDFGVFRLPGDIETNSPLIPTLSVSVPKESKEEAEAFVSYLLTDSVQDLLNVEGRGMPIAVATGHTKLEDPLFRGILAQGVDRSILYSFPVEKRVRILECFSGLATGEPMNDEALQSILQTSDSMKGDRDETVTEVD